MIRIRIIRRIHSRTRNRNCDRASCSYTHPYACSYGLQHPYTCPCACGRIRVRSHVRIRCSLTGGRARGMCTGKTIACIMLSRNKIRVIFGCRARVINPKWINHQLRIMYGAGSVRRDRSRNRIRVQISLTRTVALLFALRLTLICVITCIRMRVSLVSRIPVATRNT